MRLPGKEVKESTSFLRGDTVVKSKATLKVVRTRVNYVLIILRDRQCNPLFLTRHKLQTLFQKGLFVGWSLNVPSTG